MEEMEVTKQWVLKHFIELISQQEIRDSRLAVRFHEEMRKLEEEFGSPLHLTLSEIHLVACIGDYSPINVTTIAEKTQLTKGSITRISKRLLELDLIKRQQINENKKEVYYSLTAAGQKIHSIHHRIHGKIEQRFLSFLDQYTPEQLAFARKFMKDLIEWDY
ncbi:MarR family transcriptional regulator [Paenibacillus mucilaginosus]|uniref:Putative transcriptional regulator n=1 Tax=Paenibacillus mucilaginosus (strain KNP414) TaxID=1036673 RepID=F8F6I9_PAEMK|nr:MarR family transcriptional regulator [Paenibacillus mucilaginosus]AEI42943.1 putative transcriptional regulator [Paenibacillus mucilaginosus KNP414]MCG7216057.1 MarR family transcriptional regulator [Paenibacillus mucilaginosus]